MMTFGENLRLRQSTSSGQFAETNCLHFMDGHGNAKKRCKQDSLQERLFGKLNSIYADTHTHTQLIHNPNDNLIRLKEQTWCFASSVLERDSHCELQRAEARRLTGWSESELKPVLSSCTARLKHNAKKTISSLEGFCFWKHFPTLLHKTARKQHSYLYSYYFIFLSQSKAHTAAASIPEAQRWLRRLQHRLERRKKEIEII